MTTHINLVSLIAQQVALHASEPALKSTEGTLTYQALWHKAEALAAALVEQGVGPGVVVGVECGRTQALVLGMLAVLRAGGIVLPIDSASPPARLADILNDSGCGLVISNAGRSFEGVKTLGFAELSQRAAPRPESWPSRRADGVSFLFYTSGSTGKPKGVEVCDQGIIRLAATPRFIPMETGARYACLSNPAFDAISFETWVPLLTGGQITIAPQALLQDPRAFATWLEHEQIDTLFMTVALFNEIAPRAPDCFSAMGHVLIGGEALNATTVANWYLANPKSACVIHNAYGPTECTTFALSYPIPREVPPSGIPIGRPLAQTDVHLLGADGRPAAIGALAELWLSGTGLASGYRNLPEESRRQFTMLTLPDGRRIRAYRTGDMVRRQEDGNIIFTGRKDRQVKIRGFRIEPAEVEARIASHPAIAEVFVATRTAKNGRHEMLAYIVAQAPLAADEYLAHLAQSLPAFMHPHHSYLVPGLPLTRNGKVDKAALCAGEYAPISVAKPEGKPMSAREKQLTALAAELLELDGLTAQDRFILAGGDSLLAMRFVHLMAERLGLHCTVSQVLAHPFSALATLAKPVANTPLAPASGPRAPMTREQARLWLMALRDPQSLAYNVPLVFHVEGAVDTPALEGAVAALCQKHPALRSRFYEADTGLVQEIAAAHTAAFTSFAEGEFTPETWQSHAQALFSTPFDLATAGQLRVHWLPFSERHGVLLICLHHIAIDGWSLNALLADLSAFYQGKSVAEALASPLDYAHVQAALQSSAAYQADVAAATAQLEAGLKSAELLPELPAARPEAKVTRRQLPTAHAARVAHTAHRLGLTRFQLLQAVFGLAFSKVSGLQNFAIAAPVANRPDPRFAGVVGMFANTVLIPTRIIGPSLLAYIEQQARSTRQSLNYDHVLLSDLSTPLKRLFPDTPHWFDAMFVLEATDYESLHLGAAEARIDFHPQTHAKCPLLLTVLDHGTALELVWEAQTAFFEDINPLHSAFLDILSMLDDLEQPLASPAQPVSALAGPDMPLPFARIIEGFTRQAKATPDAIAVKDGDKTWSYQEMANWEKALAGQLCRHEALRGRLHDKQLGVALHMQPGAAHIAGLLALARLNITAIPLDTTYPVPLLREVLALAQPALLLTDAAANLADGLLEGNPLAVLPVAAPAPKAPAPEIISAGRPLYMLFTSGSTGTPKGVEVPEITLCNLLAWQHPAGHTPLRTHQFSKLSFDVSFQEILSSLCFGGGFHTIRQGLRQDFPALLAQLKTERIARIFMPQVAFQLLAEVALDEGVALPDMRQIIVAGEQMLATKATRQWLGTMPDARVWNHYGPTETHVVTAYALPENPANWPEIVPIGTPISHARIAITAEDNTPLPRGKTGALLVSGPMVAPCYLDSPALNAARFVALPDASGRMRQWYRTGDLARMGADGVLHWAGRADMQIKLSGHRIELGHIEAALQTHPEVERAIVVPRPDKTLIAFMSGAATAQALAEIVQKTLPPYVKIAAFQPVTSWPRLPSGKIDRQALLAAHPKVQAPLPDSAPSMASLQHMLEELLGHPVDSTQSFFDMGANSLDLMRFQKQIKARWKTALSITDLFTHVTLPALARFLGVNPKKPAAPKESAPEQNTQAMAIIGMAANLPGAPDLAGLRVMIAENTTGIRYFDPARGNGFVGASSLLARPFGFDPAHFGISEAEAKVMDPQQRHMLMNAVHALRDAGINPLATDLQIGMIASAGENTYYQQIMEQKAHLSLPDSFQMALHHEKDFLATKTAFRLGLKGPALTLQSACSSSLAGVHLAARLLQAGDADAMLVGGVLIDSALEGGYQHRPFHIFSKDGRCQPFDKNASGTIGASGVCSIVLRPLAQALSDNNRIYGIIEGSAINNDGADKMGFSAPSAEGQADVITRALRAAGCTGQDIGYIEAHGTGTSLGDPIEVRALAQAFGPVTHEVFLASLKSQIGHMGAGAGLAGLIRATLALEAGIIPPNLGFNAPNPEIDFAKTPFKVAAQAQPWPAQSPRRAGVSSFGIGGTNAHVIVAKPAQPESAAPEASLPCLLLSAPSRASLERYCQDIAAYLRKNPASLPAVHAHLQAVEPQGKWRIAVAYGPDLAAALESGKGLHEIALQSGPKITAAGLPPESLSRLWLAGAKLDWGHRPAPAPKGFPVWPFELTDYNLLSEAKKPDTDTPARLPKEAWISQPVWQRTCALEAASQNAATAVVVSASSQSQLWHKALESRYQTVMSLGPDFTTAKLEAALQQAGIEGGFDLVFTKALTLSSQISPEGLAQAQSVCLDQVAEVAAALAGRENTRLLLLSSGASSIDTVTCAYGGLFSGPLATVPDELNLPVHWVDLPAMRPERQAQIFAQTVSDTLPQRCAVRRGFVWEQQAVPVPYSEMAKLPAIGVHLVLGGTGGIGQALAAAILQSHPDNRVILLARTARDVPQKLARFAHRISLLQADISDPANWAQITDRIQAITPVLAGIVHAAGVGAGAVLRKRDGGPMHEAMAAKALGGVLAHRLCAAFMPEYWLNCSSMAAEFGGRGQYDYAAANGFLDALSGGDGGRVRRISVNWDIWRESGMAVGALAHDKAHQAHLAVGMDDAEGAAIFVQAVALGLPRIMVSTVPLAQARKFYRGAAISQSPSPLEEGDVATQVHRIVRQILGAKSLAADEPLEDLGVDSLMLIDIAGEIEAKLGRQLDISGFGFDTTTDDLVAMIEAPNGEGPPAPDIWQQGTSARVLVLVHPVGGDVLAYRSLAGEIAPDTTVCVLADPSLTDPQAPAKGIADKAQAYLLRVQAHFSEPDTMFVFAGWSFGALLVSEMAAILEAEGQPPAGLVLIDPPLPTPNKAISGLDATQIGTLFRAEMAPRLGEGAALSGNLVQYRDALERCCKTNMAAMVKWRARPLAQTPVHIFVARNPVAGAALDYVLPAVMLAAWHRVVPHIAHQQVGEADHYSIMASPAAEGIAAQINKLWAASCRASNRKAG